MYGSLARLPLLQLLDDAQNAQPHGFPLPVAGFQKGIGAHGSMSRRVLTVLVDQELAFRTLKDSHGPSQISPPSP